MPSRYSLKIIVSYKYHRIYFYLQISIEDLKSVTVKKNPWETAKRNHHSAILNYRRNKEDLCNAPKDTLEELVEEKSLKILDSDCYEWTLKPFNDIKKVLVPPQFRACFLWLCSILLDRPIKK